MTSPFRVVAPVTAKEPAVATLPDVSATVNLFVSTAIPPFRFVKPPTVAVPVVTMLPVVSATVKAPSTSIPPSRLAKPVVFSVVMLATLIAPVDNVVVPFVAVIVPANEAFSSTVSVSIFAVPSM